jgi:hypothetical protein
VKRASALIDLQMEMWKEGNRQTEAQRKALVDALDALGEGGGSDKPTVRMTGDGSLIQYDPATGQWVPIAGPRPSKPSKPSQPKAPTTKRFPDGTLRQWDPKSKTWTVIGEAPAPEQDTGKKREAWNDVMGDIGSQIESWRGEKGSPARNDAFGILMRRFGVPLVTQWGFTRKDVENMIRRLLKGYRPAPGGGTGGGGDGPLGTG